MFKKLDLLIVRAFIGPFVATFFITTFVLTLQFMWLYIDDVVGKGIETITVLQLLMYVSATVVPLALPLAVLLSSIMTLGNLGETYELVAIKSAGISLLRFLQPLAIVSVIITIIAFFFNNNVYTYANLRMQTLKYDIIVSKPAFDIKEGVFYDRIEGFVIKIGKKEKDDSTIRDVVIYEQNNNGKQDNMIIADSGTMVVTPDKQNLVFTLKSGWRYQEQGDRNVSNGTELVRMGFKRYKKILDLSSFRMNKTDDSAFKNNYSMLTLPQLTRNIDSLKKIDKNYLEQINQTAKRVYQFPRYLDTTGWETVEKPGGLLNPHLHTLAYTRDSLQKLWAKDRHMLDSTDKVQKLAEEKAKLAEEAAKKAQGTAKNAQDIAKGQGHPSVAGTGKADTTKAGTIAGGAKVGTSTTAGGAVVPGSPTAIANRNVASANLTIGGEPVGKTPPQVRLNDMIPDTSRLYVITQTINYINQVVGDKVVPFNMYVNEKHNLLQHEMAWHEKITLAVTCLVMFLIGAPLGSIIRKGGIGLPLVFAVIFFVIFFLLNNFGKKLAGSYVLSPANGLWLAVYVLTPIGLFLIYKALHDSQLFNKEFYFRLTRKIKPLLAKLSKKKKGEQTVAS